MKIAIMFTCHAPTINKRSVPVPSRPQQIGALVRNAGDASLSRSLGGPDVDWLALAEAQEQHQHPHSGGNEPRPPLPPPGQGFCGEMEGKGGDGQKEFVLTMGDLEEGEKRLPAPTSSMKMGCPKIPQVGG